MKTKHLFFTGLLVFALAWFLNRNTLNPETFMNHYKGPPSDFHLLIIGDSRSSQVQHFAQQTKQLFEQYSSTLAQYIYYQNKETFSSNHGSPKQLPSQNRGFEENAFYAYDQAGRLLLVGKIHQFPGEAIQSILKKVKPEKVYQIPLEKGLDVTDSILQGCEPILNSDREIQCITFQESLCFSCPSGNRLLHMDTVQKDHPTTDFLCFLLGNLEQESVSALLKEVGVTVPVFPANLEIQEYWFSTKEDLGLATHPLEGVFIVIKDKQIRLVTKDLHEVDAWLGHHQEG